LWIGSKLLNKDKMTQEAILLQNSLFKNPAIQVQFVIEQEGLESDAFWECLGGKTFDKLEKEVKPVRLFQFSSGSGVVEAFEIFNFSQDDLDLFSVFMLDAYYEVFLWFGAKSKEVTKVISMETATNYLKLATDGRPTDAPLYVVKNPFQEPTVFIKYFLAWSKTRYPQEKSNLPECPAQLVEEVIKDYRRTTFNYGELLSEELPKGVDGSKLESYLSEDDFVEIFKMGKEEFYQLTEWKRENLKKELYLF